MKKSKKIKPFNPEKLDKFINSSPKRLSDGAKKQRMLQGTHKQSRQWLAEHLIAQHNRCAYCRGPIKKDEATIDHIVPLAHDGLHDKSNTCAACEPCNTLKADMSVEEFMVILNLKKQKEREELAQFYKNKNKADLTKESETDD